MQRLSSHRLVGGELAPSYDGSEKSACARDDFAHRLRRGTPWGAISRSAKSSGECRTKPKHAMRRCTACRIEQFQEEYAGYPMNAGSGETKTGPTAKDVVAKLLRTGRSQGCAVWTTMEATPYREIAKRGRASEPWCCGELEAGILLSRKRKVGVWRHTQRSKKCSHSQRTWQRACSLHYGAASRIRQTTMMYCGAVTLRSAQHGAQLWCSCGHWSCRPHVISQATPTLSNGRARPPVDKARTCRTTKLCSGSVWLPVPSAE
ncbi:hypothetical protein DE146DRAFT_630391 [Phaeosphaeria sp. MPI-PUGE-AT-0046c]|nr:hypothetical protein DE146DRAFT_630391 [Phaeosphaeria sp. MPI-PUGE-AT-0046c]